MHNAGTSKDILPEDAACGALLLARQTARSFVDLRDLMPRSRSRQLSACHAAFRSGQLFTDQLKTDLEALLNEMERAIDEGTEMVIQAVCMANSSEGPIMEARPVAEHSQHAAALWHHYNRIKPVSDAIHRVHDLIIAEAEVARLRQQQL